MNKEFKPTGMFALGIILIILIVAPGLLVLMTINIVDFMSTAIFIAIIIVMILYIPFIRYGNIVIITDNSLKFGPYILYLISKNSIKEVPLSGIKNVVITSFWGRKRYDSSKVKSTLKFDILTNDNKSIKFMTIPTSSSGDRQVDDLKNDIKNHPKLKGKVEYHDNKKLFWF